MRKPQAGFVAFSLVVLFDRSPPFFLEFSQRPSSRCCLPNCPPLCCDWRRLDTTDDLLSWREPVVPLDRNLSRVPRQNEQPAIFFSVGTNGVVVLPRDLVGHIMKEATILDDWRLNRGQRNGIHADVRHIRELTVEYVHDERHRDGVAADAEPVDCAQRLDRLDVLVPEVEVFVPVDFCFDFVLPHFAGKYDRDVFDCRDRPRREIVG